MSSISKSSSIQEIILKIFPGMQRVIDQGTKQAKEANSCLSEIEETINSVSLARMVIKMIDQENSPIMLMLVDTEGVIRYVSKNWTMYLGYEREDMVGRMFMAYVKSDDVFSTKEIWDKMKEDNTHSFNFRNCFKKKGGGYSCLHWYGTVNKKTGITLGIVIPEENHHLGIDKLTQ